MRMITSQAGMRSDEGRKSLPGKIRAHFLKKGSREL